MDSVNSEASASGSPRGKLYLAVPLWVVAAVCAVSFFRELPWAANAQFRDFDAYYSIAAQLRHGIHPDAVDTPSWLLCFEPLTFFARFTAYKLWFLINVLALAIALIVLLRDSALGETDKWILAALIVLYRRLRVISGLDRAKLLSFYCWRCSFTSFSEEGILALE